MRLRRLDLIRYGHFTNDSFELPAGKSDFHIVFGPNEAGKSTVLAAIEDLLFGIPTHSRYGFLHDYSIMRVGACLENAGASLEVLRRKGNKDTLLDPDGSPIVSGEGVLRPYLTGADQSFFKRMFNLDHVRLQAGGREILEAKDDVGQMLFSAGTGIAGLRERLDEFRNEADELWSARRSKRRKFYIADDKLKAAKKALREQIFTASKWRELKRTYENAQEAYSEVDKKIKKASTERNRLSRIRRVFGDVRRKQELDSQLGELDDVISLPEDAATLMRDAEDRDSKAAIRIATRQEQLEGHEKSLEGLTVDETLIQRAEDIRHLHERRIEIRSAKADLPKRQAELDAAEEELRAYASELDWTETDSMSLIQRIPPRKKVRVVRTLLGEIGQLESDVTGHARESGEYQETYEALKQRLDEMEEPEDVGRLALLITTLRGQGDLSSRVRADEIALESKQKSVERRLKILNPGGIDEKMLTNMVVPVLAVVREYREREQDWKRRLLDTQQKASSAQQELDGAIATFDRIVRDEQVVTNEKLKDARSRRDALWNLVKLKHVQGETILEDQRTGFEKELEDLASAFEPAMARADGLADRRFDHAEAAGRITEIKRKIGEWEIRLNQLQKSESKLVEEGEQLRAEWASMWGSAPFEPLAVESMLEWISAREKVHEAIEEREEADNSLKGLRAQEREAREKLLSELAVLGFDIAPLEKDSLNMVIGSATEELRRREIEADRKTQLEEDFDDVAKRVTQKEHDLKESRKAQDEWQIKWIAALSELGLVENTTFEAVRAQLDIIDQMRETVGRISSLQNERIGMINQAINEFEQVVHELVENIANDLADQPAENAVLELERRLAEAERVQELREQKNKEVQELITEIAKLQDERRELTGSICHLKSVAGVTTNEELKEAIQRSEQRRSFEDERREIINELNRDGDGKSLEELIIECESVVIDEAAALETSTQAELEDLQKLQNDAAEKRSRAREAFQVVGGDDAAARAAANKQEALAEMQEIAERYVRVKTSSMLLQWAIDRYRREKQAPLLRRAGNLFKIVTGGSFSSLQVEYNDQDQAYLTGVRPGGSIVPMSGLSTGTADQLYLALRIAAVEDYLERADALPFIADDLFINFDDERAEAGFRLLEELSQKTQVLFLTHHLHLVDLAQKTIGDSVSLVTLTDQEAASAAH